VELVMSKARFISELSCSLKDDDSIWALKLRLLYYSAMLDALLEIEAGFETDFASVPRIPIAYTLYGNRAHREGVLHDWAFRRDAINPKTGKPFTFMEANKLFLEAMECRGKPWYVRYPMYSAVCAFSRPCFHKRSIKDKL
jgi:hypothetical protein